MNATSQSVNLIAHVGYLAGQHGIKVTKVMNTDASATYDNKGIIRTILIRPAGTLLDYFTALHEIGHAVLLHIQKEGTLQQLDTEIEAWEWAIKHAKVGVTVPVRQHIAMCLRSYVATQKKPPPPNHPVWDWLAHEHPIDHVIAGPKGKLP